MQSDTGNLLADIVLKGEAKYPFAAIGDVIRYLNSQVSAHHPMPTMVDLRCSVCSSPWPCQPYITANQRRNNIVNKYTNLVK